ncbi:MAG: serine/threonine-protein kinase [Methylacidiphilales bacterium]|nr:serine/threonine-protein kinase [Candidatus Methylacidiphilales bacterium]
MWRGELSFGKYQIIKQIGSGAFGEVYLAEDPSIKRTVAIKTLKRDPLVTLNINGYNEYVARFKNEASIAARCSHQNMVTIYDFHYEKDLSYLVMEFVDGTSLRDLIDQHQLQLTQVNSIFYQLLSGVAEFHRANIVHRDLKPSNIILTKDLKVKITDFGIALDRSVDINNTDPDAHITKLGTTLGTPRYMPIEQVHNSKVDQRADLYALSVVFFDLLSTCAYPAQITTTTLDRQDSNIYTHPSIDKHLPFPAAFFPILIAGLTVKIEDRIANATEYQKLYNECLAALNQELKLIRKQENTEDLDIKHLDQHIDIVASLQTKTKVKTKATSFSNVANPNEDSYTRLRLDPNTEVGKTMAATQVMTGHQGTASSTTTVLQNRHDLSSAETISQSLYPTHPKKNRSYMYLFVLGIAIAAPISYFTLQNKPTLVVPIPNPVPGEAEITSKSDKLQKPAEPLTPVINVPATNASNVAVAPPINTPSAQTSAQPPAQPVSQTDLKVKIADAKKNPGQFQVIPNPPNPRSAEKTSDSNNPLGAKQVENNLRNKAGDKRVNEVLKVAKETENFIDE